MNHTRNFNLGTPMPHDIQSETCIQPFDGVLVHEVIDIHDRSTRLYQRARPGRHGQIDIQFTRTFSGSSKPDQHRVVWQASLPPESAKIISDAIAAAITGEPS